MSKYRMSVNMTTNSIYGEYFKHGYIASEEYLIPLLEQKDTILRECREFIEKTGLELWDDTTTELLNKLKDI